ncbi:MAG: ABC transporter substrate-binding protein [Gaiellaceae bacterium]
MQRRLLVLPVLLAGLALAAAGCGGSNDEASGDTTSTTAASCDKGSLELVEPGRLTIATDNPSFPPWFIGAKPDTPWDPTTTPTKKGYEAAVAYAVAQKLGFTDDEVKWTAQDFDQLFKPGAKDYDFDINQVSYNPKRASAVGFSDSYYGVEQAVVTTEGSKIASAKSLADLKVGKFGVQLGTTSADVLNATVNPTQEPSVYSDSNDVVSAIKAGQVDGIVVDYPSALYIAYVQLEKGAIVGRLPRASGDPEHFGLVTAKGSALIPCLNKAIGELRADGTLKQLEQKWITGSAPPVLQ